MGIAENLRLISILGAFVAGFWLPVRIVGYIPSVQLEIFFDLMISSISAINIYLYFKDTDKDHKLFSSWMNLGVFLDVICFLPLSLIPFVIFGETSPNFLFLNLFAVRHVGQIKKYLDNFVNIKPLTYRLTPIFMTLPLLVHMVACGWIWLGSGTAAGDTDMTLIYVKAIYWSFTTLTTVGYGDISAKSIPQMLYSCAVEFVGVGVFGYILSNMAGLIARSDAAREHHMDNLDKVETFMKLHHIPTDLRSRIRSYYHYMWLNKKGYEDHTLLEGLPGKIQSELFFHINQSILSQVPFLKGADQELLEELMNELKPQIFVPGEKIFKIDEPGHALYFIHNGQVEIQSRTNDRIALLSKGNFFGEMALISDRPRMASAVSVGFCDIYVLEKELFDKVVNAHPAFRSHLQEVISQRKAA
jgi:hypothetical protein